MEGTMTPVESFRRVIVQNMFDAQTPKKRQVHLILFESLIRSIETVIELVDVLELMNVLELVLNCF